MRLVFSHLEHPSGGSYQTPMRPLSVLLISDRRPGHYRLSEGIIAALARHRPVRVTRLDVRRPRNIPGRVLSALSNVPMLSGVVRGLVTLPAKPVETCDVIVSAGAATLAASVYYRRQYGCPNIFYGSLRRYRSSDFGLVLTSYAARAGLPNHAMTLKPSALDPDTLPARPLPTDRPAVVGLLIGGDSGTVKYGKEDWNRLLFLLSNRSKYASWIVANSRRTPETISNRLAGIAEREGARVRFIDMRDPDAPALNTLFADAEVIAVTVDSSSMVSEGVWSRRPLVVLSPLKFSLPPLETQYRKYLVDHGWTTPKVSVHETNAREIVEIARSLKPLIENPLEQLAVLIEQRLPKLFV